MRDTSWGRFGRGRLTTTRGKDLATAGSPLVIIYSIVAMDSHTELLPCEFIPPKKVRKRNQPRSGIKVGFTERSKADVQQAFRSFALKVLDVWSDDIKIKAKAVEDICGHLRSSDPIRKRCNIVVNHLAER